MKQKSVLAIGITSAVLVVIGLLSLCLGEYRMPIGAVLHAATSATAPPADRFVIVSVREPRLLTGLMAGFAFGVSGAMLQSLLRNPLADAGVLGLNDGAGLFVTAFLVYLPHASGGLLPAVALTGRLGALALLLALTSRLQFQPFAVLLNGIGLSLLFYAITKVIKTVGNWQYVQSAIEWLQGNLTGVSWPQVWMLLPWFVGGLAAAALTAKLLEVHELGDDIAVGLGSSLRNERLVLFGITAVLAGSAISVTGPVYFVGFLAGNLARQLVSGSKRVVLLVSGLIGAAIVLVADLLARLMLAPRELRLFFIVNLVGGPALAALLIWQRRTREAS